MKNELETLKEHMNEYIKAIEDREEIIRINFGIISQHEFEIDQEKKNNDQLLRKVKSLENKNKKITNLYTQLYSDYFQKQNYINDLEIYSRDLKEYYSNLYPAEINEPTTEIQNLKNLNNQKDQVIKDIQEETIKKSYLISKLEKDKNQLIEEINQLKQNFSDAIVSKDALIFQIKKENTQELEGIKFDAMNEISSRNKLISELMQQKNELTQQLEDLKIKSREIDYKDRVIVGLQGQISILTENSSLKDSSKTESQSNNLDKSLKNFKLENEELKQTIQEYGNKIEKMTTSLTQIENLNQKYTLEKENYEETILKNQKLIDDLQLVNHELLNQIESKFQNNENLIKIISEKDINFNRIKETYEFEINNLKFELKRSKNELEELKVELKSISLKNLEYSTQIETINFYKEYENLQFKYENLRKEHSMLNDIKINLENQIKSLSSSISRMELKHKVEVAYHIKAGGSYILLLPIVLQYIDSPKDTDVNLFKKLFKDCLKLC